MGDQGRHGTGFRRHLRLLPGWIHGSGNACLPDGCYDFVIYDSYGDGICCSYGIGSYTLTDDSDGSTPSPPAAPLDLPKRPTSA